MRGTLIWVVVLVVGGALEVASRLAPQRVIGLGSLIGRGWAHPIVRWGLLVLWAWAGWHLFARYTIP
jgi:hypothetical protein